MRPLFTVITVCKNPGFSIRDTFHSVVNQTYSNIEYIIIDGVSSDGTLEWLRQSQQMKDISILISENDLGIYDAINKGISISKGELIAILHAGDLFYSPDTLYDIFNIFIKSKNSIDVLAGGLRLKYDEFYFSRVFLPCASAIQDLKYKMSLFHPATIINRKSYTEFGFYDDRYHISGDFELLRRFILKGAKFLLINECFVTMQYGGISTSYKYIFKCANEYAEVLYGKLFSVGKLYFLLHTVFRSFLSITKSKILIKLNYFKKSSL